MRKVSKAGIDLIKSFEGLYLKAYLDPIGIPTIGYGTIEYPDGRRVTMSDPGISEDDAVRYLQFEVDKKASEIEDLIKIQISDNEFAALASFAYNVGTGALGKSTLLRLLNANEDRLKIADQFLRWNKAGGKELPGLTRRRQAERSLFLQPTPEESQLPEETSEEEIEVSLKEIENKILGT